MRRDSILVVASALTRTVHRVLVEQGRAQTTEYVTTYQLSGILNQKLAQFASFCFDTHLCVFVVGVGVGGCVENGQQYSLHYIIKCKMYELGTVLTHNDEEQQLAALYFAWDGLAYFAA